MTEVAIRFDPRVWDGYAWTLFSRANPDCEWQATGSAMSKSGARRLVTPDERLIEEDPEPPAPTVCVPNSQQLKCRHDKGVWYRQAFSPDENFRFEVCNTCKSITLARGKVPWGSLPRGYALLRIKP